MKEPYETLRKIIVCGNSQITELKKYLSTVWYDAHSDMAWYNAHKSPEKLYSGYWSYESGAIVKILNLNDKELKHQQYYPYDLVHQNNYNSGGLFRYI